MKYYYHGSPIEIKKQLICKPSKIVDNEKVVFATNDIVFSVVFLTKWTNADMEFSKFSNDQPYVLREEYPGAFNIYKNASGYIYYVDSIFFEHDERLGMKEEFISHANVPIIKSKYIANVWKKLLNLQTNKKIILISFDTYAEIMKRYVKSLI